jgi:hypothetical protein
MKMAAERLWNADTDHSLENASAQLLPRKNVARERAGINQD